jgi:NAD(P)-dependent dehydrogenase (short-subunit alcohol dehydrogenase family)
MSSCEQAGSPAATFFGGDLRHVAEIDALMQRAFAWNRVDILVNNAGGQHTDPIENVAVEVWNDILAVNLSATFHTMRHALPQMARTGYGRVINIASVHVRRCVRVHGIDPHAGFYLRPHRVGPRYCAKYADFQRTAARVGGHQ